MTVRPLAGDGEVEWVAQGMLETLREVVGQELYDLPWLRQRVRWHLVHGAVFLAVDERILGHTIVRVEEGAGLFSTTFVTPAARRKGCAGRLLDAGEEWMRGQHQSTAVTYTDRRNEKLIRLYTGRGYALEKAENDFVRLSRRLDLNE